MSHESPSDADAHFTVKGEKDDGSDVKAGHVKEDESKQEVGSSHAHNAHVDLN
jgi:hypothetical protein